MQGLPNFLYGSKFFRTINYRYHIVPNRDSLPSCYCRHMKYQNHWISRNNNLYFFRCVFNIFSNNRHFWLKNLAQYLEIHDCFHRCENENCLEWPQEDDLTIALQSLYLKTAVKLFISFHYSLNMIFQSFQHRTLTLLQKANTTLE